MAGSNATPLLYLWEQRTLFIGRLKAPLDISTGASTFMLSLGEPIRFMTNEMVQPVECHSLLLPAGVPVIIDTQNELIANCTLDPFGRDLSLLSQRMEQSVGKAFYQAENESVYIENFKKLHSSPFDSKTTLNSIKQLLKVGSAFNFENQHPIDKRIVSVISSIQKTIGENLSLSDLADETNLSQSRLIELFKRQTGLPIRRYRLWYRLYKTTESVGEGKSLTEAAVEAGFTDSSHFNRTFRSMLGITPSSIFNKAKELHVILPGSKHAHSTLLNSSSPGNGSTVINPIS